MTHQRRDGDKHVYGARSRFMTDALLQTMEKRYQGRRESRTGLRSVTDKKIDVQRQLREMW